MAGGGAGGGCAGASNLSSSGPRMFLAGTVAVVAVWSTTKYSRSDVVADGFPVFVLVLATVVLHKCLFSSKASVTIALSWCTIRLSR